VYNTVYKWRQQANKTLTPEFTMRPKYVSIIKASGRGVAERWRTRYQKKDGWTKTASGDSKDVYDKLCDLGHVPDIAKVAEIIGNKSWSYIRCEGCSDEVEEAVSIGEHDAKSYCKTCIDEAKTALNLYPQKRKYNDKIKS